MEDAVCNQEFASAPLAGQEVPVGKVCDIVIVIYIPRHNLVQLQQVHKPCYVL